jgi:NAD(P)-dependent dehydrogenase (short-subunit alcohol dehydrogenase family)
VRELVVNWSWHTYIQLETLENWEHIMQVNATSAFLCYKYAAVQMVKQGRGGRIVGASSVVGKRGRSSS